MDAAKVSDCYKKSFSEEAQEGKQGLLRNSLLDEQLVLRVKSGIMQWPSISINNVIYRGAHIAQDVIEAVCASILNAPNTCMKWLDPAVKASEEREKQRSLTSDDHQFIAITIVLIILALILFVVFMVYWY